MLKICKFKKNVRFFIFLGGKKIILKVTNEFLSIVPVTEIWFSLNFLDLGGFEIIPIPENDVRINPQTFLKANVCKCAKKAFV